MLMLGARARWLLIVVAVALAVPGSAVAAGFVEGIPSGEQVVGSVLGVDCGSGLTAACPTPFSGTISWGDGTPSEAAAFGRTPTECHKGDEWLCIFQASGAHAYAEEGSYAGQFTYSYTDLNGPQSGTRQFTATVSDAPLVNGAGKANVIGYQGVPFPLDDAVLATFSDENPGATASDFVATINWGDGSPAATGTVVSAQGGGFEVHGAHVYGFPGPESITISVQDVGGSTVGPITTTAQLLAQPPFPTTKITLNPSNPNGANGWYRSLVHATVSATDTGVNVTETRCVLDAPDPPPSFDALPPGPCAFAAAGADIVADGTHVLDASSVNEAAEQEVPVRAVFRIDRTPPTVSCPRFEPTIAIGTSGALLSAAVRDFGSGPVTPTATASPDLSSPGRKHARFTGSDNAGNTTTISCPYLVLPPSLKPLPTMVYAVDPKPTFTLFTTMIVRNVAAGAIVRVACTGHGCPFSERTPRVVEPTTHACRRKRCRRRRTQPLGTTDLKGLFLNVELAAGTRVSVSVTKPGTIGRIFVFTIRRKRTPTFVTACLAPGSSVPGRGC